MSTPPTRDRRATLDLIAQDFAMLEAPMMELLYDHDIRVRYYRDDTTNQNTLSAEETRIGRRVRPEELLEEEEAPSPKRPCLPESETARSPEEDHSEDPDQLNEDQEAVRVFVSDFLRQHLTEVYRCQLEVEDLPTPDQLQFRPSRRIPEDSVAASVHKVGLQSAIVRSIHKEIQAPDGRYPQIVSTVFYKRSCRRHTCTIHDRYCGCPRKFFLSAPSRKEVCKKLRETQVREWLYLLAICEDGIHATMPTQEGEAPMALPENARYIDAVITALDQFVERLTILYQHLNVIGAICSPSSLVEGILFSRSKRPSCNWKMLWTNDVAKEYLEYHPYIREIHNQVNDLDPEAYQDTYEALNPLYQELVSVRGLDPLSPRRTRTSIH